MHVLVLGGTQFVGRYIVEALLTAKHRVSILNRGHSPDLLPSEVERLRGDRDDRVAGIGALAGRTWDACIDVSGYTPRQVRSSAEFLHGRIQRYLFVSAVSVYGDPVDRPVVETHPCVIPVSEDVTDVNAETYGRLKVTCENLIHDLYGDRSTILRPQIIVGPHDTWNRYTYWIRRAALPGPMLAPGDGSDHVQFIDIRDVARFAVSTIERQLPGPFNLAGPRLTWSEFMSLLEVEDPVWVPAEILRQAGVNEFELPLFRTEHGPRSGLMDVSNERACREGLILTDPQTTLSDTRNAMRELEFELPLSPEREAALLSRR